MSWLIYVYMNSMLNIELMVLKMINHIDILRVHICLHYYIHVVLCTNVGLRWENTPPFPGKYATAFI